MYWRGPIPESRWRSGSPSQRQGRWLLKTTVQGSTAAFSGNCLTPSSARKIHILWTSHPIHAYDVDRESPQETHSGTGIETPEPSGILKREENPCRKESMLPFFPIGDVSERLVQSLPQNYLSVWEERRGTELLGIRGGRGPDNT